MNAGPLFIVPSIATGGAEIQLMQQLAGLRARGLAPRLMVLSDRIDGAMLAEAGLPEAQVSRLGLPSPVLDRAFLRACPGKLAEAARFAAAQGCRDIVALLPPAHFFARLLKIALLARGRRVRLFQYHHSEEVLLNPRTTPGKRLFHGVNRIASRCCDHAHWHVSERVRADISGPGAGGRGAVLSNTCEMDAPGDPEAAAGILARACGGGSPFVVLLPGRMLARKGHALLIAAAARLIAEARLGPDEIRLLFAGDGPARAEVEAAVAAAGLGGHVVLLGNVPHAALLALYGRVGLVVVPSLVEGFGIVAIEALSRGALLIASDAAGLDEIVRPDVNALQFPVGDAEALHGCLRQVWEHRTEAIIDRAAARAEMRRRFGLDGHLDRMLDLLGRRPGGTGEECR